MVTDGGRDHEQESLDKILQVSQLHELMKQFQHELTDNLGRLRFAVGTRPRPPQSEIDELDEVVQKLTTKLNDARLEWDRMVNQLQEEGWDEAVQLANSLRPTPTSGSRPPSAKTKSSGAGDGEHESHNNWSLLTKGGLIAVAGAILLGIITIAKLSSKK